MNEKFFVDAMAIKFFFSKDFCGLSVALMKGKATVAICCQV